MTTKTATSTAFEALLGDLKLMAKATDVNQERIAAGRAAEGHMQHGETMAKSEEDKKKEKEEKERIEEEERKKKANEHGGKHEHEGKDGKHEHMAKSFSIQTEDGATIQVQDASDMLKSLTTRLDEHAASTQVTLESVVSVVKGQGELLKSLTDKLLASEKTVSEQSDLIKSLRGDMEKLGTTGAGRKSVLAVAERHTATSTDVMAKAAMPEGVTTDDFFAKALDMQREGRLTGVDISLAESCVNSGRPIPEPLVKRVLGTSAGAR